MYADTVRCFGETNGRVQLLAGGGVSGYRYAIDTTRYYADPVFGDLKAGTYTFWVKDQNGCRQSTSLPVTEPVKMRLSLTDRIDPLCAGDQNGIINVAASGGNSGYTYWLDNRLSQSTGRFVGLTQAEYTLKAVDRRGCEDTIQRVVLTWPKSLAAAIQTQTPRCFGDANGSVGIQLTGGVTPYGATLLTGSQSVSAVVVGDSLRFSTLAANSYEVTTHDAHGCQLRIPVRVAAPQAINPILLGDSSTTCRGQLVKLDANNPNLAVVWYLDGRELTRQPVLSATQPGTYSVSVTNATGCVRTATYVLRNSSKALQADFLIPTQAFVGDTIVALDITKPQPEKINWILPPEAFTTQLQPTTTSFVIIAEGTYPIQMEAFSGDCHNLALHDIQVFQRDSAGQTDPRLGYQDYNLIENVEISPNPNYGRFTVKVKLSRIEKVEIRLIRVTTGEVVYTASDAEKKDYSFSINIHAKQDVYVLQVNAAHSQVSSRVLILN
ncbi:SprB repeat-containing protein [Spirosoma foliorum]|uniref:SprB repeat-containing protein n=2 Tax=Spirosoma foliorum TaxID=2710596 RepID=A0A7G5H7W9_9BACT|nr:SprB repeat-containing protein [Spirosoma foliorum]